MKTKYWVAIFAGVLALCIAVSGMTGGVESACAARITVDGETRATVSLSVDTEFTVEGKNTVTVKDGTIAVTWADCPDQYCVKRGRCSGGREIVCLPNRLVITFLGEQEVDGAS